MTTTDKPVAKSLHTVTVLAQVARIYRAATPEFAPNDDEAMTMAMHALGLANRPDPYGLRSKALAMLSKA